jgi:hypothetical protein
MNWARAGQWVTVWLVISCFAAPLISRWLRSREAKKKPHYATPVQVVREPKVKSVPLPIEVTETAFQRRAREAEGLTDDDRGDAA